MKANAVQRQPEIQKLWEDKQILQKLMEKNTGILRGTFDSIEVAEVINHAYSLLIAGSAFWLLGSIHNAFQVYENTDTRVQFMQKTVSVPLLIANTLFLVASV